MDLDEIFIKCLKWDKEQSVKNTISMLMVGFQRQELFYGVDTALGDWAALAEVCALWVLLLSLLWSPYFNNFGTLFQLLSFYNHAQLYCPSQAIFDFYIGI